MYQCLYESRYTNQNLNLQARIVKYGKNGRVEQIAKEDRCPF